jgi:hypothetical protein
MLVWRPVDLSVNAQEVLALHSCLAGHAADEQRPIHAAKAFIEIRCGDDVSEEGKCAVLQFHHDAFKRLECRGDFNEVEFNRLIRAKHRSGSNAGKERIGNLTGPAGDSDFNCWFHKEGRVRKSSSWPMISSRP